VNYRSRFCLYEFHLSNLLTLKLLNSLTPQIPLSSPTSIPLQFPHLMVGLEYVVDIVEALFVAHAVVGELGKLEAGALKLKL
jgi:hypothetical protein